MRRSLFPWEGNLQVWAMYVLNICPLWLPPKSNQIKSNQTLFQHQHQAIQMLRAMNKKPLKRAWRRPLPYPLGRRQDNNIRKAIKQYAIWNKTSQAEKFLKNCTRHKNTRESTESMPAQPQKSRRWLWWRPVPWFSSLTRTGSTFVFTLAINGFRKKNAKAECQQTEKMSTNGKELHTVERRDGRTTSV